MRRCAGAAWKSAGRWVAGSARLVGGLALCTWQAIAREPGWCPLRCQCRNVTHHTQSPCPDVSPKPNDQFQTQLYTAAASPCLVSPPHRPPLASPRCVLPPCRLPALPSRLLTLAPSTAPCSTASPSACRVASAAGTIACPPMIYCRCVGGEGAAGCRLRAAGSTSNVPGRLGRSML
jgi:hypothetical protein